MNSKIYKLTINNKYYIGSTKQRLKQRLSEHKSRCFNTNLSHYNFKLYQNIREQGITKETFYEKVKMILIIKCENDKRIFYEDMCINIDNNKCLNSQKALMINRSKTRQMIKDSNKYHCNICVKSFRDNYELNNHNSSKH